jgi:hypothetical protein
MSKSHRLAWAAGFIDGDGYITIQNRTTKHGEKIYKGHYLRVGACQADILPLEELQNLFGGVIRPKNSGPNREGYNRKPQWSWTLSTAAAAEALTQMLPYFLHKKREALLGLEFYSTMSTNKQLLSKEIVNKRSSIQKDLAALNALS